MDTLGYPMNIDVHSATPHDSNCAKQVLFGLKQKFPRLEKILADRGYQGDLQKWFHRHSKGCLLTIIKPKEGSKGFQVQQCRWLIELICLAWQLPMTL